LSLSPETRRRLLAESHALSARISVAGPDLSEGAIEHIRQALRHHPLLKVRLNGDDRSANDDLAARLAAAVPCELVRRIGKIAILYREPSE
jgi:RNA-binding protein